ncbi:hypothetical protein LEP1GSC170_4753 [Leptospira interrogans serovar Bataviae str. HAI135]|nr:hypothetical protein LEP1GSC170_4753 [Leptospira interrogans serovar Bataviae str. HAI135]
MLKQIGILNLEELSKIETALAQIKPNLKKEIRIQIRTRRRSYAHRVSSNGTNR